MYLDKIVLSHRQNLLHENRDLDVLVSQASQLPSARGFIDRLKQDSVNSLAVIAEIKRKSPSKGELNPDLDATDVDFFGGSVDDLVQARTATTLPVIRKDFTVSEFDVVDARLMGADCVLLIAAVLSDTELQKFHRLATDIGLDVLVETHDEQELDRALNVGATMIGVNQRDLMTFQVDHERAERMATQIPQHVVRVAESGVRDRGDAQRLRDAGYDAVLVGESIVTSGDPVHSVRDLMVV